MSTKQPLISLDRPNNAAAILSLQTPEPTPAFTAEDGRATAIDTDPANDSTSPANGTAKAPSKAPRKPAAVSPPSYPAVEIAPAPATAAPIERIVTLGARIPASLHLNVKLYCVANNIDMQQFVQDAITDHLSSLQSK